MELMKELCGLIFAIGMGYLALHVNDINSAIEYANNNVKHANFPPLLYVKDGKFHSKERTDIEKWVMLFWSHIRNR